MHGWLHVFMLLRPPGRALSAHARPELAAADRGRQHGVSLFDDRTDCKLPMRERERHTRTHTHPHQPATALSNLRLFSQPYDSVHIFRRIAFFHRLPPCKNPSCLVVNVPASMVPVRRQTQLVEQV